MSNKNRKVALFRRLAWMILTVLLLSFLIPSALAAPAVRKAEYEGKGRIEVSFKTRVQYKNLSVTVKDSSGKKYLVRIVDKDRDDVDFRILRYQPGKTYTYTIKGVRKTGEARYSTVSGKVKIPRAPGGIPLKKVEYDAKDWEVTIEFDAQVEWKNPRLTISDGKKNHVLSISEKNRVEIEANVRKLTPGVRYTFTLSGIRLKGTEKYRTISDTFTVPRK